MKTILYSTTILAFALCLACGKTDVKTANSAVNSNSNIVANTRASPGTNVSVSSANNSSTPSKVPASETANTPLPQVVPTVIIPKDQNYDASGKVTKINLAQGSVEINHGDIPGMMPPMQMEFNVSDKKLLDGLKVGDNVVFVIEYKHPTETVVSIKKAQ